MGAAFRGERETRRRTDNNESGILVTRVVQRVQAPADERIVDRADRKQPCPKKRRRQSKRTQQDKEIAFSNPKLDVLSGLGRVPLCVAYDVGGTRHDEIPMTQTDFHHATPVYEYLDGWWEDISQAREFADLPRNAQAYVKTLEDMIGAPVAAIGTGPRRDQTLQLRPLA